MDKDLDLNAAGGLPDGTASSQRPAADSGVGVTAANLRDGYMPITPDKPRLYGNGSEDMLDIPQDASNDSAFGGFCGRPQGWSR